MTGAAPQALPPPPRNLGQQSTPAPPPPPPPPPSLSTPKAPPAAVAAPIIYMEKKPIVSAKADGRQAIAPRGEGSRLAALPENPPTPSILIGPAPTPFCPDAQLIGRRPVRQLSVQVSSEFREEESNWQCRRKYRPDTSPLDNPLSFSFNYLFDWLVTCPSSAGPGIWDGAVGFELDWCVLSGSWRQGFL